jgi:hypothetical protein
VYAVFDANNFYVSCERVVSPKLNGVPWSPRTLVGGARSNEAKACGIQMVPAVQNSRRNQAFRDCSAANSVRFVRRSVKTHCHNFA